MLLPPKPCVLKHPGGNNSVRCQLAPVPPQRARRPLCCDKDWSCVCKGQSFPEPPTPQLLCSPQEGWGCWDEGGVRLGQATALAVQQSWGPWTGRCCVDC